MVFTPSDTFSPALKLVLHYTLPKHVFLSIRHSPHRFSFPDSINPCPFYPNQNRKIDFYKKKKKKKISLLLISSSHSRQKRYRANSLLILHISVAYYTGMFPGPSGQLISILFLMPDVSCFRFIPSSSI